MTRADLISRIAAIYPYMHLRNIGRIVSIITEEIANSLKEGGRVELRGFGSFSVRERKKIESRNPRTNEKITVEEKRVPYFKPGKQLKDMVNGREVNERK
ncbi:MAG: integration host factor subunit beta [Holosporaceae bacterium]|jgi:integration host factor subunit beta|nr:integration host factor subunit beta [Holosporaceae bacterium]